MNQSKKNSEVGNFVLVPQAEQVPQQVFFDGITGLTVGAANCKLDFHQVVGVEEESHREKRKIMLTAVIPTAALIELCQNTLSSMAANSAILTNALSEHEKKVFSGIGMAPTSKNQESSK